MGTVVNTYLIAGGAVLVGAVGAAVAGLDIKVVGTIAMGVGVIVFVVGAIGLVVKPATFTPQRRRAVTETDWAPKWPASAGRATAAIDDAPGAPVV